MQIPIFSSEINSPDFYDYDQGYSRFLDSVKKYVRACKSFSNLIVLMLGYSKSFVGSTLSATIFPHDHEIKLKRSYQIWLILYEQIRSKKRMEGSILTQTCPGEKAWPDKILVGVLLKHKWHS